MKTSFGFAVRALNIDSGHGAKPQNQLPLTLSAKIRRIFICFDFTLSQR
jgi:hypothetical protein